MTTEAPPHYHRLMTAVDALAAATTTEQVTSCYQRITQIQEAIRADKFWHRVHQWPHGCWLWPTRSASVRWNGTRRYAYHIAWELTHGPMPPHTHIHHTCQTHRCINPAHLSLLPSPS